MTVDDISKLTLVEKFDLMQALSEDVQPQLKTTEVPIEHRRLLDERRARVASGESSILDWDEAKHRLAYRDQGRADRGSAGRLAGGLPILRGAGTRLRWLFHFMPPQ